MKEKSNREFVVTYVGDMVFAAAEGTHSIVQTYTFPQVFDIKEDVKESFELWDNGGFAYAWVMGPVTKILAELNGRMVEYSNIRPGEEFQGY